MWIILLACSNTTSTPSAGDPSNPDATLRIDEPPEGPPVPPPDPTVLKAEGSALDLLNPSLTIDDGSIKDFGDKVAGNGIPDGWRLHVKKGGSLRTAAKGDMVEVAFTAGTQGTFSSRTFPAKSGDTFVLRTTLDTDGKRIPGSIGIAFKNDEKMIDYALHRLESPKGKPAKVELRATAPEGTTEVFVRWLQLEGTKADGSYKVGPISLETQGATSREKAFALPHVVLVTIETFRHDHAQLYGYDRATTPTLARLASEGVRFDHHYVQAPFTRPSMASMVTSEFPSVLGVTDNLTASLNEGTTLAERFAENGYVTSAFLAQFALSSHYGFQQGFHYFHNYANDTRAEDVWKDALPWLAAHGPDNHFTWIHLFDPHGPYRPTEAFDERFKGDAIWNADTVKVELGTDAKLTGPFVPAYVVDPGQTERRHYVANYDEEIAYVDAMLGELVAALEQNGGKDNTLLVVTADHGESMTDHDRYFSHGSLYEHDIHVPMLVWAPGRIAGGKVIARRTSHIDIVPTLLEYAGIARPDTLKGQSLRPLIEGRPSAWKRELTVSMVGANDKEQVAILDDGALKVVVDAAGAPVAAYDIVADPNELTDVLAQRRAEADALAQRFVAYRQTWAGGGAPTAANAPTDRDLTEQEKEALRRLGYIE